jgi:NTP pyrophosphatase (non-canonical NTP hydrolase)
MSLRHFGTEVYTEIAAERERAHAKHGSSSMESTPVGSFIRYTILAEEVGEIAKEFNEAEHRGGQHHLDLEHLRTECIQVAAMASAWADRLGAVIEGRVAL